MQGFGRMQLGEGDGDLAGGHRCARWVEMGANCQLDDLWLHRTMVALVSILYVLLYNKIGINVYIFFLRF